MLHENVLIISFAVEPPESLPWLSDLGWVKCPDAKLQIAVDRKTAAKSWLGTCQQRLITAHCFHPRNCFGLHLHPTQQFFCYQAVNFSSTTSFLFFFFLSSIWFNDLPLACLLNHRGKEIQLQKKKDFLSRGLSCLAGVWSIELLEGGMLFFHPNR